MRQPCGPLTCRMWLNLCGIDDWQRQSAPTTNRNVPSSRAQQAMSTVQASATGLCHRAQRRLDGLATSRSFPDRRQCRNAVVTQPGSMTRPRPPLSRRGIRPTRHARHLQELLGLSCGPLHVLLSPPGHQPHVLRVMRNCKVLRPRSSAKAHQRVPPRSVSMLKSAVTSPSALGGHDTGRTSIRHQ